MSDKTIKSVAIEIDSQFTKGERTDGSTYCFLKDTKQAWMQDIIRKAHDDMMPNDEIYEAVRDILQFITEIDDENDDEESIRDEINENMEPDCYTSNLTKWLASNNSYVDYLTQAIEEYDLKDGFQILSAANKIWLMEIASLLIKAIVEYLDSLE